VTCHALARKAGAAYPYLAGQFSDYLEQQLQDFKNGSRGGAQAAAMRTIANNLTAEQSRAVADYFASLQPRTATPLPQASPELHPGD
jgi:cytochrome c553